MKQKILNFLKRQWIKYRYNPLLLVKRIVLIAFLVQLIALLLVVFFAPTPPPSAIEKAKQVSITEFVNMIKNHRINSVIMDGQYVEGMKNKKEKNADVYTIVPYQSERLIDKLINMGADVSVKKRSSGNPFGAEIVASIMSTVILALVWYVLSPGSLHNLGFKRKIKKNHSSAVRLDDVAGIDEVKEELVEAVEYLKNPHKFKDLGIRPPKGILFYGDPGVGKTLLAKAIAGEAGAHFIAVSGSDFVDTYVGTGASRIRTLFKTARKNAPCILFIDEIDTIGGARSAVALHSEREQALNQLLVEMDGFDTKTGVLVIGATNRPDILDPALLRPGRFDKQIYVPKPDLKGRYEILKIHSKNKPLSADVDLMRVAKRTPGLTGAYLENIVNEAAMFAAKFNRKEITMDDFEKAIDKVIMGLERKGTKLKDEERWKTAVHETGHAFVSVMIEHGYPLHRVSIIPRGGALGVTTQLPDEDKYLYDKAHIMGQVQILLGGRAAEEVVFGENGITTGASDDLKKATELVYNMVSVWGMDSKTGLVFIPPEADMKKDIYERVRQILEESYKNVKEIITQHREAFESVANKLLTQETLTCEEFVEELVKYGIEVKKSCNVKETML